MKSLYETCAHYSLLPRSLQIAVHYNPKAVPYSTGRFADVWKGEYGSLEVAVKVLKIPVIGDLKDIIRVSHQ